MTDGSKWQNRVAMDHVVEIVAAYVSNNHVAPGDMPALIALIGSAVARMADVQPLPTVSSERPTKAEIRDSITPDALISFIDGKPYKMLKQHLLRHGLTSESYRQRYGLPVDYPVVAPTYSARRSDISRSLEHWKRK